MGYSIAPEFADLDIEAIEEVGDEIATWAAVLHGGEHRLLALIARFHGLRGWVPAGHRSCAHWLSFRTGYSLPTAREYVRVALALEELPETSTAMERGELSFCKVRAITRVATPETEADLLELAGGATTAQLEIVARAWRTHSRLDDAELERERLHARRLSIFPDDDGMYVVQARLTAEGGASLMRAIDEISDEIYRAQHAAGEIRKDATDTERRADAARRRADSIVQLAERALTAKPVSGSRAQRYQVVVHVERSSLAADGEPERSQLEDGTHVSYETSRRIACDAGIVHVERGQNGEILDVGRRTRSIPPALRRALEIRDRGCRFPGCGSRWTDGHHVEHWGKKGKTSLDNTLLLCFHHHRLVHEGGWTVEWWSRGRVAFIDPRGNIHVGGRVPKVPELEEDPAEILTRHAAESSAPPGAWTASARWKREREIPPEVLFRAVEAGMK